MRQDRIFNWNGPDHKAPPGSYHHCIAAVWCWRPCLRRALHPQSYPLRAGQTHSHPITKQTHPYPPESYQNNDDLGPLLHEQSHSSTGNEDWSPGPLPAIDSMAPNVGKPFIEPIFLTRRNQHTNIMRQNLDRQCMLLLIAMPTWLPLDPTKLRNECSHLKG
ncbi:hypothetical protein DM01DRAFT_1334819 [Hesseltinella vesiculosa]|uniref:Uncharacterized protein n=1 Tax=Hesseltinella vesiculosa TaxID=101127 RepID=A0A1X2GLD4_9FUNG|nr:hypothetical protein DM01DRAFT_1334819 [Hesseltinella vesiculosa]